MSELTSYVPRIRQPCRSWPGPRTGLWPAPLARLGRRSRSSIRPRRTPASRARPGPASAGCCPRSAARRSAARSRPAAVWRTGPARPVRTNTPAAGPRRRRTWLFSQRSPEGILAIDVAVLFHLSAGGPDIGARAERQCLCRRAALPTHHSGVLRRRSRDQPVVESLVMAFEMVVLAGAGFLRPSSDRLSLPAVQPAGQHASTICSAAGSITGSSL